MRIYFTGTVMEVTEPEYLKKWKDKDIFKSQAVVKVKDESEESYIAVDIMGIPKNNLMKEAQISGVPQEMVCTISSKKVESGERNWYQTCLTLKHIIGSVR